LEDERLIRTVFESNNPIFCRLLSYSHITCHHPVFSIYLLSLHPNIIHIIAGKMASERPTFPRRCLLAVTSVGPSSSIFTPPLHPTLTPMPPCSGQRAVGEELPEWFLFSPSSSEGRSLVVGRSSTASASPSFADLVMGKWKALLEDEGPRSGHDKGKALVVEDAPCRP
jgi:hypothetical protein